MKLLLASGAILGFVSVAFGAYSEHGLKSNATAEDFRFLMTAVRYNQINSAVICAIGLFVLIDNKTSNKLFKISGLTFVAGTVLLSFSIYISILLKISSIQYLTPVGGITLMAAWLLLLVAALKYKIPASQRAD